METYKTKNDAKKLLVIITTSSDAKLDEPNEIIVIIHEKEDARRRKKQKVIINDDGDHQTEILKTELLKKPIVKIITSFIADNNQLPNKDRIVERTEIDDTFNGGIPEVFKSRFFIDSTEYNKGSNSDETFRVTKRVETILT